MWYYNKCKYRLMLFLFICLNLKNVTSMQSNDTCAQMAKDRRQVVCVCGKQLQLQCTFNLDIREIAVKDLDKSLTPIYHNEVSIDRTINQEDPDDINLEFSNFKKETDEQKIYLYFPNFSILSSPYVRITFTRFLYIPSFAFIDKNSIQNSPIKSIVSTVFELQEIHDFGIDKYAFYNVESENLLLEGPFNQMTIHQNAFDNSNIDELIIGCYCLECESFIGDCRVLFSQKSVRDTKLDLNQMNVKKPNFKKIKLFGVQLGNQWNIENLPNMNEVEFLEISNIGTLLINSATVLRQEDYLNEFRTTQRGLKYLNLKELHLKNNDFRQLRQKLIRLFPNLRILNLVQNKIEFIEWDAFSANKELIEIDLSKNRLKRVGKILFMALENLKTLSLKENQIESLEDNNFSSLKMLEILDLTRNRIQTLTSKTFNDLKNLKELLLSYNPLKKIDPNTFKFLAIESNLNRLDLISNTESDWFVFEDNDICLLSHFKCSTKIYIDFDQRCNCFLKYLNTISNDYFKPDNYLNSIDDSDNSLFLPCSSINSDNKRYETMMHNDEQENYVYNRDPSTLNTNNQKNLNDKVTCPKKILKNCFSKDLGRELGQNGEDDDLFNSSCLYNKFLKKVQLTTTTSTTTVSTTTATTTTTSSTTTSPTSTTSVIIIDSNIEKSSPENMDPIADNRNSEKVIESHAVQHQANLHKENKVSLSSSSDEENPNELDKLNTVKPGNSIAYDSHMYKYTLEPNLLYLVISVFVTFIISIISLLMASVLMIKHRKYVYHVASNYPPDG